METDMTGTPIVAAASKWDSEVFGIKVGVLITEAPVAVEDVRNANRGVFDVVFVKAGGWVDPDGLAAAVDHLYDMEIEAPRPRPRVRILARALLSPPRPRHLEIARTAFSDSRFLRDGRLREMAPGLYSRWVSGKMLHVLDGHADDAFLLASRDADGARRIALVAVDDARRGAGIGDALLAGALSLEPPALWRVRVSVRNHRAVRFYESAGFRVSGVSTAFHVWTEGGVAWF
jgi:GNAT superfamily N-acetyltransferase